MRTALLITLALTLAYCTESPAPPPNPDDVILRVQTSGGCAQLGPNCVQIDVFGDGLVQAYRIVPDGLERAGTGTIDRELVAALHREVYQTDLRALHERLPPGECRGCYDGIDTSMSFPFTVGVRAEMPVQFSSVDVELEPSESVFAEAWKVYEAAQGVVDVPVISR